MTPTHRRRPVEAEYERTFYSQEDAGDATISSNHHSRARYSLLDSISLLSPSCTSAPPSTQATRLAIGLTDKQVDPHQRFPYIRYGYRKASGSTTAWQLWRSAFRLHNELLNAWTMVASLVAGFMLCIYCVQASGARQTNLLPFFFLLLGQLLHTPASVCYHILMPLSPSVAHFCRKLDQSLILVLNACATFALSYYTFGIVGSCVATVFVGMAGLDGVRMLMALRPGERLNRRRVVRCIGITALGYYAPIAYRGLAVLWQWLFQSRSDVVIVQRLGLPYETAVLLAVLVGHGLGGWCYANHWPQCWWPDCKWISYFCHSHIIMHVAVFTVYNMGYPYLAFLYKQQEAGAWPPAWPSPDAAAHMHDSGMLPQLSSTLVTTPLEQLSRLFLMMLGGGES